MIVYACITDPPHEPPRTYRSNGVCSGCGAQLSMRWGQTFGLTVDVLSRFPEADAFPEPDPLD